MEGQEKPGTEADPAEPQVPAGALVPVEQVMRHPVVVEMAQRLQAVESMLHALPEAIGRAVAQAMKKPPTGASGPPVPLYVPGQPTFPQDLQFHQGGKIVQDGKEFQLEKKNLKPHRDPKLKTKPPTP